MKKIFLTVAMLLSAAGMQAMMPSSLSGQATKPWKPGDPQVIRVQPQSGLEPQRVYQDFKLSPLPGPQYQSNPDGEWYRKYGAVTK